MPDEALSVSHKNLSPRELLDKLILYVDSRTKLNNINPYDTKDYINNLQLLRHYTAECNTVITDILRSELGSTGMILDDEFNSSDYVIPAWNGEWEQ